MFKSSCSEGLMCVMELAIVGIVVEVEKEFGFAEAREARL